MACVGSTVGFQPEMVPSSVANRNRAGPWRMPADTTKSELLLKAIPVGAAVPVFPGGSGMVTTIGAAGGKALPEPSYTVDTPVPLSEIQKGPAGEAVMPHGLTRCLSRCAA